MSKHLKLHKEIRTLRSNGLTYSEINHTLGTRIPKSSLSYICRDIILNEEQIARISELIKDQAAINRQKAVLANKRIFDDRLRNYREQNRDMINFMKDRRAKLVALAMLYLGEGAKWQGSRAPKIASSDPMIVKLYIDLLRECYGVPLSKLKLRVQHRADQNPEELVEYWSELTGVKNENFYPCYVDKRTIGKSTKKTGYKGVCTVSCSGTYIQLELAEIAGIIGGAVRGIGAAG